MRRIFCIVTVLIKQNCLTSNSQLKLQFNVDGILCRHAVEAEGNNDGNLNASNTEMNLALIKTMPALVCKLFFTGAGIHTSSKTQLSHVLVD